MTWLWGKGRHTDEIKVSGLRNGVKDPPKKNREQCLGEVVMKWWVQCGATELRMTETSKWRCSANICTRRPTGIREWESEPPTLPLNLTTYILCFQYFVFTGVLAMVTCAVFLRLNSVLKLAVLLIMIAIYALLTETIYSGLFLRYDNLNHSGE